MKQFTRICYILVLLQSLSAGAQTVNLNCNFVVAGVYTCILTNVAVADENAEIVFGGNHVAGLNNGHVMRVEISGSEFPSIPTQLFTTFPSLNSLLISTSTVTRIRSNSFINARNLNFFAMTNGRVQQVESNGFTGALRLINLEIFSSHLETIHATSFDGLTSLRFLFLDHNRLTQLPVNVFRPLKALTVIFLSDNELKSLDGRLLEANTLLENIDFQGNQINAVGPNFFDTLANLRTFSFLRNQCASNAWILGGVTSMETIRQAMTPCFNNFVETPEPEPENQVKNFILELRGSLVLRGENGDEILSV